MDFSLSDQQERYRGGIRKVCAKFPNAYWRALDAEKRYPEKFVLALSDGGWLSVLIPTEYGGAGVRVVEACLVPGGVNTSRGQWGGRPSPMYTHGAPLRQWTPSPQRPHPPAIPRPI